MCVLLANVAVAQAEASIVLSQLVGALDSWETSRGPRWCVLNDHWGAPAGSQLRIDDYPGQAAEDPEVCILCRHARLPVIFSLLRVQGGANVPAYGPLAAVVPEGRRERRHFPCMGGGMKGRRCASIHDHDAYRLVVWHCLFVCCIARCRKN